MHPTDSPTPDDGRRLTLWRRFGNPAFKARGHVHLVGWDPTGTVLYLHPCWAEDSVPWVERWDVRTGERLAPACLPMGERVARVATDALYSAVRWKREGSRYGATEVWDLRAGELVAALATGNERSVFALSADGRLAVHSDFMPHGMSCVRLSALPGGEAVGEWSGGPPVAVSDDGSLIAARRHVYDLDVRYPMGVWRRDGTLVATLGVSGANSVAAVDFSRDGRRLVAGLADGGVVCWEVATGELLWCVRPHEASDASRGVEAVARSADGETYFALEDGRHLRAISATGEVRWRGTLSQAGGVGGYKSELLPSPDGASLAVCLLDRPPRIVDAATGVDRTPVEGHRGLLTALAVSSDGRFAASGDDEGEVRVYDLAAGDELWTLEAGSGVRGLAFTRDGRSLRTVGKDGGVQRWSLATGFEEARWRVRPTEGIGVVAAGDGTRTLVISERRVQLWSDQTAKPVTWSRRIEETRRFEAAFSDAEARVVVAVFVSERRDPVEWALLTLDAATGRQVGSREVAPGRLVGLRSTDDGPLSVTVAGERMVVREAYGARREVAAREASAAVRAVAVSGDGRWMALADRDDVELWSLGPTARCVGRVRPAGEPDAVARIALSHDGGVLVVGTACGVVTVYQRTGGGG